MNLLEFSLCFLALVAVGTALECYVCNEQKDNRDKCIKTTIQCREHEDTCRSYIHWRQPRYWTPRSERIHSIDKSCDTRNRCENEQNNFGLRCMRNWYRDWECTECCQGDRCNFYVTLGAAGVQLSLTLLFSALAAVHVVQRLR